MGAVECALFASPAYLGDRGTPKRPADLAKHDCIRLRGIDDQRWSLMGRDGTSTQRVSGPIVVDDETTAIAIAAADGGIVVLPVHYQSSDPTASNLVRVLPEYRVRGARAQLVYASSRHTPSRISLLCDAILEHATGNCPTAVR